MLSDYVFPTEGTFDLFATLQPGFVAPASRKQILHCLLPFQIDNDFPVGRSCIFLFWALPTLTPEMRMALTIQRREDGLE